MTKREVRYDVLFLFAGLNEEGYNDDEANGGGLNTGIDLLPFDNSEVFRPLLAPPQFWAGCADVTVVRETRQVTVPREKTKIRVR